MRDTFQFSLMQVDVDGAGLKLINVLRTLVTGPSAPVEGRAALGSPTLRSTGIAILRSEQAEELLVTCHWRSSGHWPYSADST